MGKKKRFKDDKQFVRIGLNASGGAIKHYLILQDFVRTMYVNCVVKAARRPNWKKIWHETHGYDEKIPSRIRYCLDKYKDVYKCKYGSIPIKDIPSIVLEVVSWYGYVDGAVLHYKLKQKAYQVDDINFKTMSDLLYKISRDKKKIIHVDMDHPTIPFLPSQYLFEQAIPGYKFRKRGTVRMNKNKWDIDIREDSIEWLRTKFPSFTCKFTEPSFIGFTKVDGKVSMYLGLAYVNTYDPKNINACARLTLKNPYIYKRPNAKTPTEMYPFTNPDTESILEKDMDACMKEAEAALGKSKLTDDEVFDYYQESRREAERLELVSNIYTPYIIDWENDPRATDTLKKKD